MFCPDVSMRRRALASVAAVIAVAVAGSAAAQSMVVRSTGPSASKYPTGAKLKASDKLTLAAGDRIVLMQAGKTRTLSGPGTFSASRRVQGSQPMRSTVPRPLAHGPTMRPRGAFPRGPDVPHPAHTPRPNLLTLDHTTRCEVPPAP